MRKEPSKDLDKLAYEVIGAAMEVHRKLGPGFLESVYEEALCVELREQKVAFQRQFEVAINYKGHAVGKSRLDLLIEQKLIVELKTTKRIDNNHLAQTLNYLKATGLKLGLIINFGNPRVEIKRVVNNL